MLDRPGPTAEDILRETTERWIGALDQALQDASEAALEKLFAPDSHWRNIFGVVTEISS